MNEQAESCRLRVFFEAALLDYEKQTDMALANHPVAERLQNCDSVDSITAVICEQTQGFSEFRGKDKVMKSLKSAVSVLCKLSSASDFGQGICQVCPQAPTELTMSLTLIP